MALKMPVIKRDAKIDYLGATTIVGSVTSLLLYLNWAGEHFGWQSAEALSFIAVSVVLAIAFIFAETRAVEPIIPLRLFRNPIFSVGNAFGFLIGFAIFGGAIYLPLYLQTVKGMSPTESGLAMLPMVAGMFSMSIVSGQLITRTGKYKIYPIIGSIILDHRALPVEHVAGRHAVLAHGHFCLSVRNRARAGDDDDRHPGAKLGRSAGYGSSDERHDLQPFVGRSNWGSALRSHHGNPADALFG